MSAVKPLAWVLTAVMAVGLAGCQGGTDQAAPPAAPATASTSTGQAEPSTTAGSPAPTEAAAEALAPGPVLLLPGYGGAGDTLEALRHAVQQQGRKAVIAESLDSNFGDLGEQAQRLEQLVQQQLSQGGASVDLVGFSAGGLVLREWGRRYPGSAQKVRRVVTLGSPHYGTKLSSGAWLFDASRCPVACQQMDPGSAFLRRLNAEQQFPQQRKLSVITNNDQVVYPPETSRWPGALNVVVQDVCPGREVAHLGLPSDPEVVGLVLRFINGPGFTQAPGPDQCQELQQEGGQALGPMAVAPERSLQRQLLNGLGDVLRQPAPSQMPSGIPSQLPSRDLLGSAAVRAWAAASASAMARR